MYTERKEFVDRCSRVLANSALGKMQATEVAVNVLDSSALYKEKRQTSNHGMHLSLRVNRFRWYRSPDSIAAESFFLAIRWKLNAKAGCNVFKFGLQGTSCPSNLSALR